MMGRQFSLFIVLGAGIFTLAFCGACATPKPVVVEEVEKPAEQDPFDLFSGVRISGDGPFRVQAEPMAIEKVRLVVEVLKVRVTTMENPDGGSEKEINLRIKFTRADRSKVLWMEEGESASVLGVDLKLLKGGDSYVESRQEYFPFALLEVK